jgi:hypothetical protein
MVKGVGILPEDMDRHFAGLNYPANKNRIIEYASDRPELKGILNRLNRITDKEYNSPADIYSEIARFE